MKINGKSIKGPNIETIVIPRGDDIIVFKAEAVLDYKPFDEMVPNPTPPMVLFRGDTSHKPNYESPDYKAAIGKRSLLKYNWMVIKSLSATEGLEWETINMQEPSTWALIDEEFKNAGFTPLETNKIFEGVLTANGMNEEKLEKARKSFLAQQAALANP